MANTDRLAQVAAMLVERDEEFRPFEDARVSIRSLDEPLWAISELKELLSYEPHESLDKAVNRAKVTAGNASISIADNFKKGDLFDVPGELFVTKYAALLIIMNADVRKERVAVAQSYFALQINRQQIEDEKRLKTRLDVATENHKLSGVACEKGVKDFKKFNGVGVSALYGGRNVKQIRHLKGLKDSQQHLDYAGSEELAANLFRITQTAAALRRQDEKSEDRACQTHSTVAKGIRNAILEAGNAPPESLPAASVKIDVLATRVKKGLTDDM